MWTEEHLAKVVNDLGQNAYIDTVRGRNGGIRFMRAAYSDGPQAFRMSSKKEGLRA